MKQSRQQSPGLLGEVTTLRPTTPMSHAESDFSKITLVETVSRPPSPQYGIPQSRSAQSGAGQNRHPGSDEAGQYDTAKFWKPFTVRLPYLIFLNLLTLLFIVVIETLYYISNRDDGLLFMKDIDDLPIIKFFAVQYLPTLVAVLYGICWSIVDLDSKRLEPFYDLSKPGGAKSDALFLEYQYQFALFVPFRALFKRHWGVFLSSTIFLVATLILTPLQSSLLATVEKVSIFETSFNVTSQFLPLNASDSALTPEFLLTDQTITRLNGKLPGFTADGDSFLPFKPSENSFNGNAYTDSNWTVTGTAYSLAVECVRPDFLNVTSAPLPSSGDPYPLMEYSLYHQFGDGVKACNITDFLYTKITIEDSISSSPRADTEYFVEWDRPTLKQWCGYKNTTTVAVANYRFFEEDTFGIQAVICELKGVQEYKQDITVNATTHEILERGSARRVGKFFSREEIDLIPFDAALFDKAAQAVLGSDRAVFADAKTDLRGTLTKGRPIEALMDFEVLKDAAESAYKYFFSLAIATSPAYLSDAQEKIPGKIVARGQAIVVDRTFATVSDTFLGIVLVLGIILAAYSYQRGSSLKADPDSLSATMSLIANSELPSRFKGLDTANTKLLKDGVRDVDVMLGCRRTVDTSPRASFEEEPTPLHLRLTVGMSFLLAHLAIIAFLAYLFFESRDSGLPVLSDNSFAFNLIWAFIPTLLATILEPIWASINRDISLLQPFYNLIKRNVPAKKSLSLKYQTIPVLLMARSFMARDFLLSLVSFTTVLVSLLAVTLPGIFLVDLRAVEERLEFKPQVASPVIPGNFWLWDLTRWSGEKADKFLDPFAAARANISDGIALPPWSTREHAFIPVRPTGSSMGDLAFYRAYTLGFRGGMECRPIINGVNGETVTFHASNKTTTASFSLPNIYDGKPSELISCGTVFGYKPPQITETSPEVYNASFGRWPFPNIANRAELFDQDPVEDSIVVTINSEKRADSPGDIINERNRIERLCSHVKPIAWSQRSFQRSGDEYMVNGPPKEAILICEPKFTAANFSVEVDMSGNIRSYKQDGPSLNFNDFLQLPQYEFQVGILQIFERYSFPSRRTKDWAGLLMTILAKNMVDYTNHTELAKLADETSALSYSIFMAQSMEDFLVERDPTANLIISGKGYKYQKRVVMSVPLTITSLVVLGLFCCTLSLVYGFRRRKYLPRQPTSLASMIAYCQESSLLDDVAGTWAMSTSQRQKHLENLGFTYGFGWYQGWDGSRRLGVDKEPLLTDYVP
ncbi:hypothetical protein TWF730_010171 [Orbilia blumenaviensis]|uniref:Uncharacterized protein n=1 Tax=Orbilia blumenaviensis TaxID=1796055 RepID=A0AAV9US36_9PEZI